MTEGEVYKYLDKYLENLHKKILNSAFAEIVTVVTENEIEAFILSKNALEELQQYRALGTVEDIKKIINFLSLDGETSLIDDMNLLNQYCVLGTPEELREAMEKQVPKKPNEEILQRGGSKK